MSDQPKEPATLADLLARRKRWSELLAHAKEHGLLPDQVGAVVKTGMRENNAAIERTIPGIPDAEPTVIEIKGKLFVWVRSEPGRDGLREVTPIKAEELPIP